MCRTGWDQAEILCRNSSCDLATKKIDTAICVILPQYCYTAEQSFFAYSEVLCFSVFFFHAVVETGLAPLPGAKRKLAFSKEIQTWRIKSFERGCEVFQLMVTNVEAIATGNICMLKPDTQTSLVVENKR